MFTYRKLGNYTYTIVENHDNVTPFLRKWLGREWEIDAHEDPDQLLTREWLRRLGDMEFTLGVVEIADIVPRDDVLSYEKDGYSFQEELKERLADREESLLRGVTIEPLVVRKSDMELMDGYTRYTLLKKLGEIQTYAYLGE